MQKIAVCIIGENCLPQLELAIDSVLEADVIVFIDGNDVENTDEYRLLCSKYNFKYYSLIDNAARTDTRFYITSYYDHESKGGNGKQRNKYLEFMKKNFPDYWCLVLDADECVENFKQLKEDIQTLKPGRYNPKMRHLVNDLLHEDTTIPEHWCFNRLFLTDPTMWYDEVEHPILNSEELPELGNYSGICLWHFAYALKVFDIKKRYENHLEKSISHSPEYLKDWYLQHIMGAYPNKPISVNELPKEFEKFFMLEHFKEMIYFSKRMLLELNHWDDAVKWQDYFKPKKVLDIGCGIGLRMYCLDKLKVDVVGLEISKYAISISPFREKILNMDIGVKDLIIKDAFDFIYAYDVLEHMIDEEYLDNALENIYRAGTKNFLFSVPFIGDPNLELDKTHHIKASKQWWLTKLESKGFKIIDTPQNFRYRDQLIVAVK